MAELAAAEFMYEQPCAADVTTLNTNPGDPDHGLPDGLISYVDLTFYQAMYYAGEPGADLTTSNTNPGDPGYGVPDGTVDGSDLFYFVDLYLNVCP
ncbi:MAG: GC-type dockerin domain-anchored protein [Planctomycetota bacterium]